MDPRADQLSPIIKTQHIDLTRYIKIIDSNNIIICILTA